jgi:hypothetical protein
MCPSLFRKTQPRGRFQRTFVQWMLTNHERFLVKLSVHHRTDKEIVLIVGGLNPKEVYAVVRPRGIMVVVEQDGEFFDALFDLDIQVERILKGYVCTFCCAESPVIYPTREDLWRDHLLESFLAWVNIKLARAQALRITKLDGCTWATLLATLDEPINVDPAFFLLQNLVPLDGEKLIHDIDSVAAKLIPLPWNEKNNAL